MDDGRRMSSGGGGEKRGDVCLWGTFSGSGFCRACEGDVWRCRVITFERITFLTAGVSPIGGFCYQERGRGGKK